MTLQQVLNLVQQHPDFNSANFENDQLVVNWNGTDATSTFYIDEEDGWLFESHGPFVEEYEDLDYFESILSTTRYSN